MNLADANFWLTDHSFLRRYICEKRYEHSLEVSALSEKIAQHHHYPDPSYARLAGLYHDIAKDLTLESMLDIADQYGHTFLECELRSHATMHAATGMLIVKNEMGIKNRQILSAIRYHTTGRANMNLLEKIVYLADLVEAGKKVEHALVVKKLVYSDIDKAIWITAKETIKQLLEKGKVVCTNTLLCYNHYSVAAG